jgi:AraC family transcriptional regulator of arabinose operon
MLRLPSPLSTTAFDLLVGHFHQGSGYRVVRRDGVGDWLLIATVSGKGRFAYAAGELVTEAGDWVLIRPGTPHDYGVEASLKHWELVWAHFRPRPHWLPWLDWPEVSPGLLKLAVTDGDAIDRFRTVHRLFVGNLRRSEAFAMNALEALLLECDRQNPLVAMSGFDERIRRAIDYLERNLGRKIMLADIAVAAGLSTSRLAHLFREQTGQTPQQYVEGLRMQRASELLKRTGFSIKQISDTVGFDSQFYFSQRFKAQTGQSPSNFRSSARTGFSDAAAGELEGREAERTKPESHSSGAFEGRHGPDDLLNARL